MAGDKVACLAKKGWAKHGRGAAFFRDHEQTPTAGRLRPLLGTIQSSEGPTEMRLGKKGGGGTWSYMKKDPTHWLRYLIRRFSRHWGEPKLGREGLVSAAGGTRNKQVSVFRRGVGGDGAAGLRKKNSGPTPAPEIKRNSLGENLSFSFVENGRIQKMARVARQVRQLIGEGKQGGAQGGWGRRVGKTECSRFNDQRTRLENATPRLPLQKKRKANGGPCYRITLPGGKFHRFLFFAVGKGDKGKKFLGGKGRGGFNGK